MITQSFEELKNRFKNRIVNFKDGTKCSINIRPYNSGRIFMSLHDIKDRQQYCRVTLDIDSVPYIEDLIIVKDYAENQGVYEALLNANIIQPCERKISITEHSDALICFLTPT